MRVTVESVVRCNECDTPYVFRRIASRRRAAGHVKHVWCVTCGEITAHTEERVDG